VGGAAWKEDLQWARRLSEGWDLGRVRQARQAPPANPASVWPEGYSMRVGRRHVHAGAVRLAPTPLMTGDMCPCPPCCSPGAWSLCRARPACAGSQVGELQPSVQLRAGGQVAGEVLGRLGEDAGAWLDRGTEHPHRIALSVRGDRASDAAAQLRAGFEAAGVQARPWGCAL